MNWLGPIAILGGSILSAEMHRPGGNLQKMPPVYKTKVPVMTGLCALGFLEIRRSMRYTRRKLDELAMNRQLKGALENLIRENPQAREPLEEVGRYYGIWFEPSLPTDSLNTDSRSS